MSSKKGSGGNPDTPTLMCKKIAQLTKVIYHLNTQNEDHALEMDTVKRQHKGEVSDMLQDAASKIAKFKSLVDARKDEANAGALLERERERFAKEKERAVASFKKQLCEGELALHGQYGLTVGALTEDVTRMRAKFEDANKFFSSAAGKLSRQNSKASAELAQQSRAHAAELEQRQREAREKYEAMLKTQVSVNDDLRRQGEEREEKALRRGRAEGEKEAATALGKLRAELSADREEALALQQRAHADELRCTKSEKDALGQALSLERAAHGVARGELARSCALCGELEQERDCASREAACASCTCAELEQTRASLELALADANRELLGLRSGLEGLSSSSAQEVDALRARSRELEHRATALEQELCAEKSERAAESQRAAKTHAALETKYESFVKSASDEMSRRDAALAEAGGSRARLEQELLASREKICDCERRCACAKADCDTAADRVVDLERQLAAALNKGSDESKALVQAEKRWAQRLETCERERKTQRDTAERERAAHIAKLEEELLKAQKRAADADAAGIAASRSAAAALRTAQAELLKVAAAEREASELREKAWTVEKTELESQLRRATEGGATELSLLRASNEKLAAELKDRDSELKTACVERKRMSQVVESLKQQVEQLRAELEAAALAAATRLREALADLAKEHCAKAAKACADAQADATKRLTDLAQRSESGVASQLAALEAQLRAELAEVQRVSDARAAACVEQERLLEEVRAQGCTAAAAASAEIALLETRLSELDANAQREVEQLLKVANDAKTSAAQLQTELEQTQRREAALEASSSAARACACENATRLENTVTGLERALAEDRASLATKGTAVVELQKSLANVCAEFQAAKALADRTLEFEQQRLARSATERLESAQRAAADADAELRAELARVDAQRRAERAELEEARREDVARLTATMEQREETARTFHVDEVAALNAERERRLEALHSEQTLHNQTMLDAFEADRKRNQAAYFELECAHQELADRYQNRESRAEDVSRLAHLEAALADTAQQLERAKKEMAYFKRELINREENFNKKFGAAPNVGVMSVIKPSNKTAPAKPRPMR